MDAIGPLLLQFGTVEIYYSACITLFGVPNNIVQ